MTERPDPVFEAPWHAQVFALTVHLNEAGHFEWPEWAARFSAKLKDHGVQKELNGGDDYFHAWLSALEDLLVEDESIDPHLMAGMKQRWVDAYLSTPHGQPVTLSPLK